MKPVLPALIWLLARCCAAVYAVGVSVLVTLKVVSPWVGIPWPEVFYGPAITVACGFALTVVAAWLGSRWDRASP